MPRFLEAPRVPWRLRRSGTVFFDDGWDAEEAEEALREELDA